MNVVKKCKLWIAVAVLAVTAFLYEGNLIVARAEATATVTADAAKIRSEASTSSTTIGSTTRGTKLPVLGSVKATDGIWYQVKVEGDKTGYIRSDLVSVSGEVPSAGNTSTQAPTVTNSDVVPSDMTSGLITKNSVNVRKGAAATDALAGTVRKDTVVTITGETTGADGKIWYQIESGDVKGFIRSDLLEASAAVTVEDPVEETVSDAGVAEVPEQPQQSVESGDYTDVANVIATRKLPEGTSLESLNLGADVVQGWESERYYIIYTKTKSNVEQWYLYDAQNNVYERINSLTPMSEEAIAAEKSSGNMIVLIVLAAIIVILIGVVVYLALQLRDYQMDYEYDDDDEEEDDDYYEGYEEGRVNSRAWKPKNFLGRDNFEDDLEDEEEDDEEEEEEYRRPVKRTQQREAAPKQQPRQNNGVQQPKQNKGSQQPRQTSGGQQPKPQQRPVTKPVQQMAYDDAEDEDFEFEFLNMSEDDFIE